MQTTSDQVNADSGNVSSNSNASNWNDGDSQMNNECLAEENSPSMMDISPGLNAKDATDAIEPNSIAVASGNTASTQGTAARADENVQLLSKSLEFPPLKISLYELLIRQLLDDGFKDLADKLSMATNISGDSEAPSDCLFSIFSRVAFSMNLACAAQLDTDSAGKGNTSQFSKNVLPASDKRQQPQSESSISQFSPPNVLKRLATEIVSVAGMHPDSQRLKWLPLKLSPVPPVGEGETTFDLDSVNFVLSAKTIISPKGAAFRATERWTAAHKANCTAVACTANGKLCASGGEDNAVRVMSWKSDEAIYSLSRDENSRSDGPCGGRVWTRVFTDNQSPVTCLAFHPNLSVLFSGSQDGNIQVYNLARQNLKRATACIQDLGVLRCLAIHPCGEYLLTAGNNPVIRLHDLNTIQTYSTLFPSLHHQAPVTDLSCSSNGAVFASSSCDGTVKIWDAVSNTVVNCLSGAHSSRSVEKVNWSKNNLYLLTSGSDGMTRIWDMRTGKELLVLGTKTSRNAKYNISSFLSDERYIVNINSNLHGGDVAIYNSLTATHISTLQCHPGQVTAIECLSREFSILTAASDCRCRLIDLETEGRLIMPRDSDIVTRTIPPASNFSVLEQEEMSIDL